MISGYSVYMSLHELGIEYLIVYIFFVRLTNQSVTHADLSISYKTKKVW
jgi:hypothetical protein